MADTNTVVAALVREHIFHRKARPLFNRAETVYITHMVISELSHVLHKLNVPSTIFQTFITHPKIHLFSVRGALFLAVDYLVSNNLSLSHFVDVSLIYTLLLSNIPLLTFDRKLVKRAKEIGTKVVEV